MDISGGNFAMSIRAGSAQNVGDMGDVVPCLDDDDDDDDLTHKQGED